MDHLQFIRSRISDSVQLKSALLNDERLLKTLGAAADAIVAAYKQNGKTLFCGNGGSAADAQHLAAELSGRYYYDRPPLFAEALHVNTSYITAVANDYGYEEVYARLVTAMGRKGDVLLAFSTSGNSPNVLKALQAAKKNEMITVGFSGEGGGKMAALCDHLLAIPSKDTPRIQECHMLLGHTLCEIVESNLFPRT